WIFLMLLVSAVTVRSYNFLLPAYAVHVVGTDARGLGLLMAASGLGAMGGAFTIAMAQPKRRSNYLFLSCLLSSLGILGLGPTHYLDAAVVLLLFVGLGMQIFVGSSNIIIQTLSPDAMRGRTIGVYSMILMGMVPGGALLIGMIATVVDLRVVLIGAG